MSLAPTCPYCGNKAKIVGGEVIYPHRRDLYCRRFWACLPCEAHVGCHNRTAEPLGTPAKAKLRQLRAATHAAFDPIWKTGPRNRFGKRLKAYAWLSEKMGIPPRLTHIGMFDEAQCRRAIDLCMERMAAKETQS